MPLAEKDISEKTLEAYNNVFADIVNVLLFDGEPVVDEDQLTDASPISQYKADDKLHEQKRDVSKFWNHSNVRLALYGVENQTKVEADMPLRVISYDGAAYRAQLLDAKRTERFPVVTLILYFGEPEWVKPKSLLECLEIPEKLKPYVNDYRIHVFDIPRLEQETVRKFKSDFRIVAEYFTQMHRTGEYVPETEYPEHVHEVLQLLSVMAGDHRFEEIFNEKLNSEVKTMNEFLNKVEARGETRGITIGEARAAARYEKEIAAMAAENTKLKAQLAAQAAR